MCACEAMPSSPASSGALIGSGNPCDLGRLYSDANVRMVHGWQLHAACLPVFPMGKDEFAKLHYKIQEDPIALQVFENLMIRDWAFECQSVLEIMAHCLDASVQEGQDSCSFSREVQKRGIVFHAVALVGLELESVCSLRAIDTNKIEFRSNVGMVESLRHPRLELMVAPSRASDFECTRWSFNGRGLDDGYPLHQEALLLPFFRTYGFPSYLITEVLFL